MDLVFCQKLLALSQLQSPFYAAAALGIILEEDLITNLSVLQSHVESMFDRARLNDSTLRKFQAFEIRLLQLNSLASMITHILDDAKKYFDLDVISLFLVDDKGEIGEILGQDIFEAKHRESLVLLADKELLKATFGGSVRPYTGAYKQQICEGYFAHVDLKPSSVAIIPLKRRDNYLGALNLGSYQADRFVDNIGTYFVEHLVAIVSVCLENILNFETIKRTSFIDTLTGVNNRRCFEQRIGEELDRCQRSAEPISCLFLDLDHFKSINDTYGHLFGDKVLTTVGAAIKTQLRNNDVLARYGGEEFIALLSGINELKALEIAERIRKTIQSLTIEFDGISASVTLSIGSATYLPDGKHTALASEISTKLIKAADTALYVAKEHGRNRVENGGIVFDNKPLTAVV
jgi:diguanylate cyclase (GGDEF)-like protein